MASDCHSSTIPCSAVRNCDLSHRYHLLTADSADGYIREGTPQDQALHLAVDMLVSLLHTCTTLVQKLSNITESRVAPEQARISTQCQLSAPLRQFLPSVKVWADWLICHVLLWQRSRVRCCTIHHFQIRRHLTTTCEKNRSLLKYDVALHNLLRWKIIILAIFSSPHWENILFELGSERVNGWLKYCYIQ